MTSDQKNVILVILVIAVVVLALYDTRSGNPPAEQSDSVKSSSSTQRESNTSESDDDSPDAISETELETSVSTTADSGDTSNSEQNDAKREEQEEGEEEEEEDTTQSKTEEGSSDQPDQSEASSDPSNTGSNPPQSGQSQSSVNTNDGVFTPEEGSRSYYEKEGGTLRKVAEISYESGSDRELVQLTNPDNFTGRTSSRETGGSSDDRSPETRTSPDTSSAGNPPYEAGPGRTWYRVKEGDSLWKIAEKTYGTGKHFTDIWELNKDRLNGYNDLRPGNWLLLPDNP